MVSPLLVSVTGYGYEFFSYTWLGNGLWSQEWGMFLLPLAWGLSWRAVQGTGRGRYALAALVVGLTIAMHFLTGYFALLSIGVFVIVVWRGLLPRVGRAAIVFAGAALVASWVVVPLITGGAYFNQSIFNQGTFWLNSYGAPQALGWLFTGQLFDYGRFPIVSLLVVIGTVVCICRFRSDSRARALLGLMAMSIVLFSGRQPFGFILNLLPGNADLYLSRYMMGIQLAGDVLAGVGLVWMGESVIQGVRSWKPRVTAIPIVAGLMAGAVLITLPGWVNRAAYAASDSTSIGLQVESDQTDGASLDVLINDIKARGGGRTYAGLPGNWGQQYDIGQVPVYAYLADNDVDEFGFTLRTPSLLADNEAYFNQNDPAQYQLYNVRYILMPVGMTVPVPATLLATSGRHRLYEVATSGYLQVVDTSGIIEADRSDMAAQMQPFLRSAAFQQGELATVAFDGGAASAPTLPIGATPTTGAGTSADVLVEAQDGYFAGSVNASRTAAVVLKVTYDPLWHVRRRRTRSDAVHGRTRFRRRHGRTRPAHRRVSVRGVLALRRASRHRRAHPADARVRSPALAAEAAPDAPSTGDAARSEDVVKRLLEVSILMPCLNEAETIGRCVDRARESIAQLDLRAEILVADNGSTDGSQQIALAHGAKVVTVDEPGYGAAIRGGVAASSGRYIIMGDADESYDFAEIPPILERLRVGDDLVMGNRFAGGIEKGCDAVVASLDRESRALHDGADLLLLACAGLPLRAARVQRRRVSPHASQHHRHGVRERDRRQGVAGEHEGQRGSDLAAQGWPQPAAAPAHMARRLETSALPAAVLSAVAVRDPGPCAAAVRLGHDPVVAGRYPLRRIDRARHPHDAGERGLRTDRLRIDALWRVHQGVRDAGGISALEPPDGQLLPCGHPREGAARWRCGHGHRTGVGAGRRGQLGSRRVRRARHPGVDAPADRGGAPHRRRCADDLRELCPQHARDP